jgi:hypothetical protein
MRLTHGTRQRIMFCGYKDEMHVVWHQAIRPTRDLVLGQLLGHKV